MRWLGALAVILVGGAIYLYWTISEGSAKPTRSTVETPAAVADSEREPSASNPSPATTPSAPQPAPPAKAVAEGPSRGDAKPAPALPVPAAPLNIGDVVKRGPAVFDPDVLWTETERQQWLWTAGGRYEKGNFPGSLEASLEVARRNPGSAWEQDAWAVAVKSYCGMAEPEKAKALFAKLTDQTGIDDAIKGCTDWNVKLAK